VVVVIVVPITVAARSMARTVFARLNAGVVGSNPTKGMGVCVRLLCVCVVLRVGSGLTMGWSPVKGVLPTVYRIKKMEEQGKSNIRTAEPQTDSSINSSSSSSSSINNGHGMYFKLNIEEPRQSELTYRTNRKKIVTSNNYKFDLIISLLCSTN
jgi:hypothetical protein